MQDLQQSLSNLAGGIQVGHTFNNKATGNSFMFAVPKLTAFNQSSSISGGSSGRSSGSSVRSSI